MEQNTSGHGKDGPRVNNQITANPVRLVDHDGTMIGVVSLRDALTQAERQGLDLVEISPAAEPPVCKILDYGKYRYQLQKKKSEIKKNQKTVEIKEIKVKQNIATNDYKVKLKSAERFLADGNKVRISMRFRGREMAHSELGMAVIMRFRTDLEALSKVDLEPKMDGNQIVMLLSPRTP